MTEPERADEFREAVAKIPSRSFRPTKKHASGLAVILAISAGALRLATYESRTHHVDNTAYLECLAQQQQAADLGTTDLGFPTADPSFGIPGADNPVTSGDALTQAVTACAKYAH